MDGWRNLAFEDHANLVNGYDDLPLWSAPFGQVLLDAVNLVGVKDALDVGCGTGFPLMELAERLGPRSHVVGLDPWSHALARIRLKCQVRGIHHVNVHEGVAESLPFPKESFDLVVSNNGFNNVQDQAQALREAHRVMRPGAQLVMTINLPDTMRTLYDEYDALLARHGLRAARARLQAHIQSKRQPITHWIKQLTDVGFAPVHAVEHQFQWRFSSGEAVFHHWFIRLAFLEPWVAVLANDVPVDPFFTELQEALDARARQDGGLSLIVPFVCLTATRAL